MAAQTGKTILVKLKDDAGTPAFQTVQGLRTRRIAFNAETVDITNADTSGNYREILDAAGVQSASFSGDGVFVDDAGFAAVWDAFNEGELRDVELTVPGFGVFTGKFKVTQLEMSGEYNGEVAFSTTWESAGAITFT